MVSRSSSTSTSQIWTVPGTPLDIDGIHDHGATGGLPHVEQIEDGPSMLDGLDTPLRKEPCDQNARGIIATIWIAETDN